MTPATSTPATPVGHGALLHRDVVERVHRIEEAYTNWYLVEEDGRLTVVDCGLPTSWHALQDALRHLGHAPNSVEAVVLTHAHFDHMGFAERARTELGVPVYVHENDAPLTEHPWRYDHERARTPYVVAHPSAAPILASLLRRRAWWPPPLKVVVRYESGATLPVPGSPQTRFTPGHTHGHCALYFPEREAVIAGDAVVTFDPYTARRGPRLVARAATVDSTRNLRTLDEIATTGARTVLVGHGDPWTDGAESVVARAREAGAA